MQFVPVCEGDQLVDDDRPVLLQLPIELRRPLGPKLSGPLLRREPQGDLAGVDVEEDLVFREQAEDEIFGQNLRINEHNLRSVFKQKVAGTWY